jgi:hypothetical protein
MSTTTQCGTKDVESAKKRVTETNIIFSEANSTSETGKLPNGSIPLMLLDG